MPASTGTAIILSLVLFALLGCGPGGDRAIGGEEGTGAAVRTRGGGVAAPLRFRADGSFKIVQFTDTQDDHEIDPRTVRLMEAVLDEQEPDLVVFTGDNIRSGPETADQAK